MATFLEVLAAILSLLTVTVLGNLLQQVLLKNPHEPPLVFHWVPVIGSTLAYGIDPFRFLFDCKAKVPRRVVPSM